MLPSSSKFIIAIMLPICVRELFLSSLQLKSSADILDCSLMHVLDITPACSIDTLSQY